MESVIMLSPSAENDNNFMSYNIFFIVLSVALPDPDA